MDNAMDREIKKKIEDLSLDIVIPIFILNAILQFTHFFPNLNEINIWDEATYIQSGFRLLTQGQLPRLAGSPLSSVFYALTILPVQNSKNFFLLADAIGRIGLFALIFFSAYLMARELRPYANPWVMMAFVFIVPVASTMFLFPSDILLAGFAGLAFWQMLAFFHHRNQKSLWWASAFMGLAALGRAEGLLLIGVMLIVTLMIVLPSRQWFGDVLAIVLPFILIVVGYILIYGLAMGDYDTGLAQRTYSNFESGQEGIYSQSGVFIPTISARLESREAFGTPEMNDNSVFKAIFRNPQVYWQRLRTMGSVFIRTAIKAYGNKFILITVWLGVRGVIALLNQKHFPLVVMGILWFIPWGAGLLNTFLREGYFMMPYFVIFVFSAIGLTAILDNFENKSERIALVASSGLVLIVALLSHNSSMFYRSALFVFGFGIVYLLWRRQNEKSGWGNQALWVLLVMGFIIRGSYVSPELPSYGRLDMERSVYFLQDALPARSEVLAGAPANIWAARMTYYGINSYDIPEFESSEKFFGWIRDQGIDAVYVDEYFPQKYLDLLLSLPEKMLREVYTTPERDILIYLVEQGET